MNKHQALLKSFTMQPSDERSTMLLGKREEILADKARKLSARNMDARAIAELLFYLDTDEDIAKLARKEELEAADKESPQYCAMPKSVVLKKRKQACIAWIKKVTMEG
jgi:hypothetical protein